MATATAVNAAGIVTVSGTSYSGSSVLISATFTSGDGKRRYAEQYVAPVVGGVLGYPIVAPFTLGTFTIRTLDPVTMAVIATATNLAL